MKFALVLLTLSCFWLLNCAGIHQKKNSSEAFFKTWSPVLNVLNQPYQGDAYLLVDLTAQYQSELTRMESEWVHQSHAPKKINAYVHEQIEVLNREALQQKPSGASYRAIVEDVLRKAEAHPTASTMNVDAYEDGGQIGFCFGRALLVHYLLLTHGVLQQDISKVFALGELFVGGQFWRYHIAMVVHDAEGMLVVDPLYKEITTLTAWMNNVAELDVKTPSSRARFFLTDPRKFMPEAGAYSPEKLAQPELRQYFSDMVATLTH